MTANGTRELTVPEFTAPIVFNGMEFEQMDITEI